MTRIGKVFILAAAALLGLVFATEVFAQEEKADVVYKKRTVIDFSDVTITGELTRPEGSYIMNRKKAKFDTLIKVRENFLPELLRSVDNI